MSLARLEGANTQTQRLHLGYSVASSGTVERVLCPCPCGRRLWRREQVFVSKGRLREMFQARPRTRVLSLMTGCRLFVYLGVAMCAASAPMASAQQQVTLDGTDKHAVGVQAHLCVDPSDAMARRRSYDQPCKLPMYQLPRPAAPQFDEPPRWQLDAPGSPASDGGHAMFWRFPFKGDGPHGVPRHTWR